MHTATGCEVLWLCVSVREGSCDKCKWCGYQAESWIFSYQGRTPSSLWKRIFYGVHAGFHTRGMLAGLSLPWVPAQQEMQFPRVTDSQPRRKHLSSLQASLNNLLILLILLFCLFHFKTQRPLLWPPSHHQNGKAYSCLDMRGGWRRHLF